MVALIPRQILKATRPRNWPRRKTQKRKNKDTKIKAETGKKKTRKDKNAERNKGKKTTIMKEDPRMGVQMAAPNQRQTNDPRNHRRLSPV